MNWTVEPNSRNVITVRLNGAVGDEWWMLLRTDAHHDNPECDRKCEYRHLDEAVARGAGVIDAGDCFCAMQGKFDKRADKSKVRPEHQRGDYLDRLVETTAADYAKYAKNWIVFGQGNHETAIRKKHETDLIERLVQALKPENPQIQAGGYSGWVRFMLSRGTHQQSLLLYYYHGTGGGGPVTRGVIQTNRMAVFIPDADFILTGHTHDQWIVPIARQRISKAGVLFHDEQVHIRTPGYKDGWGDGFGGFEVEKMLAPKPKGAAWLRFRVTRNGFESEATRAT